MEQQLKSSKSIRNYYVDIISFLPFLFLLLTGIIMLAYHGGLPYDNETLGLDGNSWMFIHKTLTIIALPLVILHLALHFNWLKKLFTFKLKNKHRGINVTLFVLFVLCSITALLSWLIFNDSDLGQLLRGLHNKIGILLIVFFAIHLISYTGWILGMTKKLLNK